MPALVKRMQSALLFVWRLFTIVFNDIVNWFASGSIKTVDNEIILITGGGRGIGRKIALGFARLHPKHIIICGRTQSSLLQTAKEVQEQGVNCAYMVCDVSSREQIYSMAKEVEAKFGQVTMLINNAGVVHANSIINSDPAQTEATFRTNTLAHLWTTRAFLPGMVKQNKGHIVTISSMLGLSALNGAADYCSSKFASSGFTEALRDELVSSGHLGIKVTIIYPYHVDNEMFAGITTRFPSLFSPINEDYLAQKIITAILTNREKVIVPKLMYLVALFYSISPVSAVTPIMKFTGVHKAMDQFHENHHKP
ncbi:short-chain dehydrogenase/reductase 3-like [Physella acuta]|uniref:short-chain dehydrogenase/reductase 3-like n=1 Tax=Physella acuta TaxID=109671 RepID=UPI0027DE3458|nr:short-chain dehydrogenase/reductase 3-like [Physella acuta]